VVEHIGARGEDAVERPLVAAEVGHQDLDRGLRQGSAQRRDRGGEVGSAAVLEVVARHARHDDMAEAEPLGGRRDARRLVRVRRAEPCGRVRSFPHLLAPQPDRSGAILENLVFAPSWRMPHGAEAAVARAHVADDQERRRPGGEALPSIGAARLVADRVQAQVGEDAGRGAERAGRRRPDLEPRRLPPDLALARARTARRPGRRTARHRVGAS